MQRWRTLEVDGRAVIAIRSNDRRDTTHPPQFSLMVVFSVNCSTFNFSVREKHEFRISSIFSCYTLYTINLPSTNVYGGGLHLQTTTLARRLIFLGLQRAVHSRYLRDRTRTS